MPITQDRLHSVVRAAQDMAEIIAYTKTLAAQMNIPDNVASLNSVAARTNDEVARAALAVAAGALMTLHSAVQDMQIKTETLVLLAEESAHYRYTAKQNMRQAAYQRRKRRGANGASTLGKDTSLHSPDFAGAQEPPPGEQWPDLSPELQAYLDGNLDQLPPRPRESDDADAGASAENSASGEAGGGAE